MRSARETEDGREGFGRARRSGSATFASFRYRDYRYLFAGQTAHALALWMENIARPLLVLEITDGDAAQLGAVIAVQTLPMLLFGVWAGVVADWFDRRSILLLTKWSALAISVLFAALLLIDALELWHIYALAFLRGTTQAFEQPARTSMVPSIVPRELVTNALGLLSSSQNLMRIMGAAGAGLVAELVGLTGTFVLIALVYVGAVLATQLLRVPTHERPAEVSVRAMSAGLLDGFRLARHRPEIRGVLIISLVQFTFGMAYMQVFAPLFAVDELEIGRGGLGAMLAVTGVGALAAALIIANRQPQRLGLILPLTVTGFGGMLVAFALGSYAPGAIGVGLAFVFIAGVGALQTTFMALSRSLLVQASPADMRGRVLALISLDRAMMAAGAALGGLLAAWQGVQVAQIVFGLMCVVGGLAVLGAVPGLRAYVPARDQPSGQKPRREHVP